MDKTININLGGTLFQIDEDAYKILRDYLNRIEMKFRNVPGGNETLEDIELRIAEIFASQKGTAGVITKENVEAMIGIIGKPEDFGQTETENTSSPGHEHPESRKMFRNPHDTIISGVCGGIGTYLNTDPVWIRILFVIFALFFGIGFFVYLALWIALPYADTESKLKDMYGSTYYQKSLNDKMPYPPYQTTSSIGHAINEVFRALGKVLFVCVRIFLIVLGTTLVLTGFLALLSFIMVFVFKYPGSFSTDAVGFNIAYVPDFINFIVSPAAAPWIKGLIAAVVIIPLLALIYGGIRLIFWFKARDGYIWLAGFVLWMMCGAALSIILFNEGIGYAESEKVIAEQTFTSVPDTLFIVGGRKISGLSTDKEISVPDEDYNIFISEEKQELYIRTSMDIEPSEGKFPAVAIRKHSTGRSRFDAKGNAEKLEYNYRISGDSLILDEFFTIPKGRKWSFDYVGVTVKVPEKTIVHMDRSTEVLFHSREEDDFIWDSDKSFWLMTENGLNYIGHQENRKR